MGPSIIRSMCWPRSVRRITRSSSAASVRRPASSTSRSRHQDGRLHARRREPRAPFGSLPYRFVAELHDLVVARIGRARSYRLTCGNGSDLTMALEPSDVGVPAALTPFKVRNFPVMIFPPISAARAEGRVALGLAILSTSIHDYPDPVAAAHLAALLDIVDGRIVSFGGDPAQAERVSRHFDRVARLFGADPRAFNSWHTGINPTTFFRGRALDDLDRWGDVAFGSPSYTHFHMVGQDRARSAARSSTPPSGSTTKFCGIAAASPSSTIRMCRRSPSGTVFPRGCLRRNSPSASNRTGHVDRHPLVYTLPGPTAATIAIREGWLEEEFAPDGIAVRSLASSTIALCICPIIGTRSRTPSASAAMCHR